MEPKKKRNVDEESLGVGLAIGVGVGFIFGVIFGNIGLGIALGAAFGITFGTTFTYKPRTSRISKSELGEKSNAI